MKALTWAQLERGAPCPGCHRPLTGQLDDRDAFLAAHTGHGSKWNFGGGPVHCSECCPPPPISPWAAKDVAVLLRAGR